MIDDVELAMVARLKAKFPTFTAEAWPDKPEGFAYPKKKDGFLVNYDGATFGELTSLSPMSSDQEARFVVTLFVASLRGPKGANNVLRLVRKCFFGWRPARPDGSLIGPQKFVPVQEGFVDTDNGVWRFAITFKTTTVAVEDLADDTGPLLKEVILEPADDAA